MRKMSFENYRSQIGMSFFPGILGNNFISATQQMFDGLQLKFNRLAQHLRRQEQIRLGLSTNETTVNEPDEPTYCC